MNPYTYPPQTYWGLDPLHRACLKMFIQDVLDMETYPGHPNMNVFAYKNHPISRVDLMGWVVRVEERERVFNYAIDDGTGVINCVCWKPKVHGAVSSTQEVFMDYNDSTIAASASTDSTEKEFADFLSFKTQEIKKCTRQQRQPVKLGDLLHVRGRIKSYRGAREVGAAYFRCVEDPTCSIEIQRMMERPRLYRSFYDIPFQLPGSGKKEDYTEESLVKSLQDAITDFLNKNNTVLNFEIKELATVDSLMAVVKKTQEGKTAMSGKQVISLFTQAVRHLEDLGTVYKRSEKDDLYVVIDRDETLESTVLDILRQESQNRKYSDSGCHYRHVLDCLKMKQRFAGVGSNVVMRVLDKLESQSDIISTSENYYIAF